MVVLEPSDSELVTELFRHVSPDSLYRRFLRPVITVDQFRDALVRPDALDSLSLGALIARRLVGVAQYARHPHTATADMAILVADAYQRQNLGARLVSALALVAEAKGVRCFAVSLQLDNSPALSLIRRLAPSTGLRLAGGGVAEATISLADINLEIAGGCRHQSQSPRVSWRLRK